MLKEFKEFALSGNVMDMAIGIIMGAGVYIKFGSAKIAIVMLLANAFTMTMAGLWGAIIPIFLHKRGFDPAISSTIFLTTVTDCSLLVVNTTVFSPARTPNCAPTTPPRIRNSASMMSTE